MDNFDLKKYLSDNPLLREITVTAPRAPVPFPETFMEDFDNMTEGYLEGSSPESILNYEGETYDMDRFRDYEEDDFQFIAFQNLINNVPPKVYYLKSWFGFDPAPGAPLNSFDTRITITPNKEINVATVAQSNDGENAGWFNMKGDYFPDLEHFTEDGDPIENAE